MGEYAKRKSDGEQVKIGTCENMYYLRFEDRHKVERLKGNVDPVQDAGELRFRLPFPDEDGQRPGDYREYARAVRLTRKVGEEPRAHWEDFADEATTAELGTIQLRHEASGLLVNVLCYHGQKLPALGPDGKASWNGKGHSLELSQLRPVQEADGLRVYPLVKCRHCSRAWRYEWADVIEFIADKVLRERLAVYAAAPVVAGSEGTAIDWQRVKARLEQA